MPTGVQLAWPHILNFGEQDPTWNTCTALRWMLTNERDLGLFTEFFVRVWVSRRAQPGSPGQALPGAERPLLGWRKLRQVLVGRKHKLKGWHYSEKSHPPYLLEHIPKVTSSGELGRSPLRRKCNKTERSYNTIFQIKFHFLKMFF